MFKRTGALLFLGLLYLLAAKIGSTFQQALMIFSIFIWTIAAGMFVYLILFRGMKLNFFQKQQPEEELYYEDAELAEEAGEGGERKGEVLSFPPSAA